MCIRKQDARLDIVPTSFGRWITNDFIYGGMPRYERGMLPSHWRLGVNHVRRAKTLTTTKEQSLKARLP